ncbi:MAG: hypothetical protein KGJ59_09905 [Bacteroidota bacterium]|nr:hypothetical protein [Bacteroidota bacterium]
MYRRFIFSLILGVIALAALQAQEIQPAANSDSISSCSSYLFWVDGGKYPLLGNSHTGDFLPKYNLRLGIGKPFRFLQFFGFTELTYYKFDPLDLSSSHARRYDIALYGTVSIFQIFSLGLGAYYTHQDNITEPDWSWSAVTERGVRSYVHIYYLIGMGYQIGLSNSISLPIGLYYRNDDFPRQDHWGESTWNEKLSLRLGIIYTPFTSNAREIQLPDTAHSLSNRSSYQIWVDGGNYPLLLTSHTGDYLPTFNARLGFGKSFRDIQLLAFAEWTSYKFDPSDALSPPFESGGKGYDVALYGATSIYRIFSFGLGGYYTHQDNVLEKDWSGNILFEKGVRSYVRLYYMIGVGYQIGILNSISLPIGLYYRNHDYPSQEREGDVNTLHEKISLRLGIIYKL